MSSLLVWGTWLKNQPKMPEDGSPPLARGTFGQTVPPRIADRITPPPPRLRGEHIQTGVSRLTATGSPPLARGTFRVMLRISVTARITPACAGNILNRLIDEARSEDHPRLRGEHKASDLTSPAS